LAFTLGRMACRTSKLCLVPIVEHATYLVVCAVMHLLCVAGPCRATDDDEHVHRHRAAKVCVCEFAPL
jgi:hypothetical protein